MEDLDEARLGVNDAQCWVKIAKLSYCIKKHQHMDDASGLTQWITGAIFTQVCWPIHDAFNRNHHLSSIEPFFRLLELLRKAQTVEKSGIIFSAPSGQWDVISCNKAASLKVVKPWRPTWWEKPAAIRLCDCIRKKNSGCFPSSGAMTAASDPEGSI
jgi:hypothetical protein